MFFDFLTFSSSSLLDCFSRGLLREALGQLAGLKRRKLALEMLGAAVQAGLSTRFSDSAAGLFSQTASSNKRQREAEAAELPTKRLKTEAD